MNDKDSS